MSCDKSRRIIILNDPNRQYISRTVLRTTNGSGGFVFYAELCCVGTEFRTITCNGHQVICQHLPLVTRVTERMKPHRFGTAIRVFKVE